MRLCVIRAFRSNAAPTGKVCENVILPTRPFVRDKNIAPMPRVQFLRKRDKNK